VHDPIVIDPPGFDVAAAWRECSDYVDRMCAAGRDIAASFGADPGCCSCPACEAMHWAWGQRCTQCGFEYPTDWWPMYSYGVQASGERQAEWRRKNKGLARIHAERMAHSCYRYGFEHPVEDAWDERTKVDWRSVLAPRDGG
jgi:hypothetical protein